MDFDYLTLTGLIEAYSPSGSEDGAVNFLINRMKTLGFSDAYRDDSGNCVGVMGSGPRQFILLGHIDTVPGIIPVRIEQGVLFGRGSVDAKAPLACFVDSVAQIGPIPGLQIIVIGAVDEERYSNGARYISTRYKPDFAIIGEPNRWDRIALGYKGSAWATLTIKTEQFHSAHPGESACELLINKWWDIKAFVENYNSGREKLFDRILLTLREMKSESNSMEQFASIGIGARLPVDLSPTEWYAKLNELVPEVQIEPTGFPISAYVCEKNSIIVRALLSGIRAAGGKPSFVFKTGTADLNIVGPIWNCPAAVYGPGDSALDHTPNEHISMDEYKLSVEALSQSIKTLATMTKLAV